MAEITVVETEPEIEGEESEETSWQFALLEVKNTLESSFREMRLEFQERESKNQELIQTLLSKNEELTRQITEANNRMVDLLTPKISPEPEIVIVEPPHTDTQNLEGVEIDQLEPDEEEKPPVPAVRKRRTL